MNDVPMKGRLCIAGNADELREVIAGRKRHGRWDGLTAPMDGNHRGELVGIGIHHGIEGRRFRM